MSGDYNRYQAKKAYYNGTWYDSNTEAKVAESFDGLGIVWEYHRHVFRDSRLRYKQYTPDFHLPNTEQWIEVCGVFDERHENNVGVLCDILNAKPGDGKVLVIGGELGFTMSYGLGRGVDGPNTLIGVPWVWNGRNGQRSADLFFLTADGR